jgi:hypothetical protein
MECQQWIVALAAERRAAGPGELHRIVGQPRQRCTVNFVESLGHVLDKHWLLFE